MAARLRKGIFSIGLFMLVMGVVPGFVFPSDSTVKNASIPIGDFYPGVVTGLTEKLVQVNNTDYAVAQELVIRDQDGRRRGWKDLRKGLQVHIHLKQGKIDHIIRILPE